MSSSPSVRASTFAAPIHMPNEILAKIYNHLGSDGRRRAVRGRSATPRKAGMLQMELKTESQIAFSMVEQRLYNATCEESRITLTNRIFDLGYMREVMNLNEDQDLEEYLTEEFDAALATWNDSVYIRCGGWALRQQITRGEEEEEQGRDDMRATVEFLRKAVTGMNDITGSDTDQSAPAKTLDEMEVDHEIISPTADHLTDVLFLGIEAKAAERGGSKTYRPNYDHPIMSSLKAVFRTIDDIELHVMEGDSLSTRRFLCHGPFPHHVTVYSSINRVPGLYAEPSLQPVSFRWFCGVPEDDEEISLDRVDAPDPPRFQHRLVETVSVHVPASELQEDMVNAIESGRSQIVSALTSGVPDVGVVRLSGIRGSTEE